MNPLDKEIFFASTFRTEVAGKITRKHVYEIAKIKSEDANWQMFDMREICKFVIDSAYTMGRKEQKYNL